jgi:hypothetical protein
MNKDVNASMQPEDTYRDALNMDLSLKGEQLVMNRMKSVSDAVETGSADAYITVGGANASSAEILGVAKGIGTFSNVEQECIAYFTAGVNALGTTSSRIFVFLLNSNALLTFGGVDLDLGLQQGSAVSSFITRDRGRSFLYFTDGVNPYRRLILDDSIWPSITSVDELNVVREFLADNDTEFTAAIKKDGNLIAGTYQFAFRLKKSVTGIYTKWTTITNPLAIVPQYATTAQYGGLVGEATDKSIEIDITFNLSEEDRYDIVELATIKNTTGDAINQSVAFISSHDLSADTISIIYDGGVPEFELPVTEITVDDAPINTAAATKETNGRAIIGNITYFDRTIAPDEGVLKATSVIKEEVDYRTEANTRDKRGYFRDELYRFGIVYHDRFGNWSPVKPFDFTSFNRTTPTATTRTITSIVQREKINTTYNTNRVVINVSASVGSDFAVGDVVLVNFGTAEAPSNRYFDVFSVGDTQLVVAAYEDLPTTTLTVTTLTKCLGNAYSHAASSDFKFPDRSKYGYNVKGADYGNALGLSVTIDGTTHPSWATGFAIVRMERDRNIIYQTPLVPATRALGVITPGKNTQTNKDYIRDSRGIGQFDHLTPKIMQLGIARGMIVNSRQGSSVVPLSFEFPAWRNAAVNMERWNIAFAPAVDYVANFVGKPLIDVPETGNLDVKMKDLVAFVRGSEQEDDTIGWKTYLADDKDQYLYNGGNSNYKIENGTGGSFVDVAYPRIQDTAACFDNLTQTETFAIEELTADRIYPIVQGGVAVPLDDVTSSNLNGRASRLNDGSNLVTQQRTSTTSIPSASLPSFTGTVEAQRSLGVNMSEKLLDPLLPLSLKQNYSGIPKEIMWSAFDAPISPRLYDNTVTSVSGQLYGQTSNNDALVGFGDTTTPAQITAGNIANALYVANIEAGKTDTRYGSINTAAQFIFTGAYHKIVNTSDVQLNVWGGDCFISRFVYKVNDSVCVPRLYEPLSGTDVAFGAAPLGLGQNVAKTGIFNNQPEYVAIWMESEANCNYFADRNRFPVKTTNLGDYTVTPRYAYNFGYSIQNGLKRFFSRDESVEFIETFPARLAFSDARVIATNDDGYSRFRALNFFDLEEKYGGISAFAETQGGDILAVQQYAIRNLPIGKSMIQDEDGTTLSVQSGQFISDFISYVSTQYGSTNNKLTIETDLGVFVLDDRSGALLRIGGETSLIQLGRMEGFFNDNYSNQLLNSQDYSKALLGLGYDKLNKELHIIGYVPSSNTTNWLVYNGKLDAFSTRLDYVPTTSTKVANRPFFIESFGGRTLLLQTKFVADYWTSEFSAIFSAVSTWRGGSTYGTLLIGSNAVNSEIEYICNADVDVPKTFDIVGSNSFVPFSSYSVVAFNDGGASETTGTQSTNINTRDGVTYAPFVRDNVAGGRLRGVYATIKLVFSNTSVASRIYSVFTQIRKSFR